MDPENPLAVNVAIHIGLSIFDMGISAAAGAAAAATGAHVNGNATTAQVLGLGAIAGLLKSGIMNAAVLMSLTMNNVFVEVLLIYVMSTFGAAVLVTSYVALKVLDRVPDELLIAAAAAGTPMMGGTIALSAVGVAASTQAIGWDALSGYTFARVAQNHKFHVCEYKSAAAAGAVYAAIAWFAKLPLAIYYREREKEKQRRMEALHAAQWAR